MNQKAVISTALGVLAGMILFEVARRNTPLGEFVG